MDWSADVNISGTLASVGARLIEGTAQKLIGQTFTCIKTKLQDEVVSAPPAPAPAGATAAAAGPAAAPARPRTQPRSTRPRVLGGGARRPGSSSTGSDRTTNRGSARREECRRRGHGFPRGPSRGDRGRTNDGPPRPCGIPDQHRRPDDDERLCHRRPGDPRGSRDRHGAAMPRLAGGRARVPELGPEAHRHHPRPLGSHRRGSRGPAVVRSRRHLRGGHRRARPRARPTRHSGVSGRRRSRSRRSSRRSTSRMGIASSSARSTSRSCTRQGTPRVRSVSSPGRVASCSAAIRCSAARGVAPTCRAAHRRRWSNCCAASHGLPDYVRVFPGHGRSTSIGRERPWLDLIAQEGRLTG